MRGCVKGENGRADSPRGESYEYKEIKLDNEEEKKFFEGSMAWDLVIDGKEVSFWTPPPHGRPFRMLTHG